MFVEKLNNHLDVEPFVDCGECGRKMHRICALWHEGLEKKFICKACRKETVKDFERRHDKFGAKRKFVCLFVRSLPSCEWTFTPSGFIERSMDHGCAQVWSRQVSCGLPASPRVHVSSLMV